jgi:tetratricopeptide (TPR) repeat protein
VQRLFWFSISLLISIVLFSGSVAAQTSPADPSARAEAQGRLLLVLPFENHTSQPNLDWVGEGAANILNRRLDSAGFLTIGRGDRLYALDRLGLPQSFQPSHATTIRIAQTLDADSVILGFYILSGDHFTASAQILNVKALKLGPPIREEGDLKSLLDILNSLAWRVACQLDPSYSVAEQTFLAADAPLRVEAFENYIRGIIGEAPSERIVHLKETLRLDPSFTPAWFALGMAYFANQDYDSAAATFGHLPKDDPKALEADFYRGLAFFYTANYMKAEDAFAFVSIRLPLPEVVNNQAVAASRRGRDSVPLFQQAVTADPKDPDYRFNLAVGLRRRNDIQSAIREIDQELKLRPQDTEAQAFSNALRNPASVKVNPDRGKAVPDGTLPLERIKRSYNESGFRQAAFELEQVEAMRLASLPAETRASALVRQGDQFMSSGLTLEAERQFQAALQAYPSSAPAHSGLAQVREHSGDANAARQEAQKSLALSPNVPAYLVLARLDLATNQLGTAAIEVSQALKLEPANANARGMKQALESRGQQVP